ncbi:hypothetical protein [Nostoc sp. C110]
MSTTPLWLVLCGGIIPLIVMPLWCGFVSAQITPDSILNTTISQNSR